MASLRKNIFEFLKKRWYMVLILLIGLGLYFYQQQTVQAKKIKESTYTIKRQNLRETLSLSGQIDADEHVTLRFPISGKLVWLGAKEGDRVKKYQGLASLDLREVQKKMQKTLNDFTKERYTFDQSQDDNQRIGDQPTREAGDTMKRLLEKAQYNLNNSILDVEIQDLAKEYSYLYTPIEGILVRVDAKYPGVNITPAGAEFEVVNPQTVYFSATADQTDVIKLTEGMKGDITFDPYPDSTYKGEISQIGYTPKTGETGTVYAIKIKMTDQGNEYKFKMGMTGDVEFSMGGKSNVVSIPSTYVKSEGEKKYVWKVKNGKNVKTYIKIGLEADGDYEILSGLEEGEVVTNVL
jgi:RND family efflux transporter MFP subunit